MLLLLFYWKTHWFIYQWKLDEMLMMKQTGMEPLMQWSKKNFWISECMMSHLLFVCVGGVGYVCSKVRGQLVGVSRFCLSSYGFWGWHGSSCVVLSTLPVELSHPFKGYHILDGFQLDIGNMAKYRIPHEMEECWRENSFLNYQNSRFPRPWDLPWGAFFFYH